MIENPSEEIFKRICEEQFKPIFRRYKIESKLKRIIYHLYKSLFLFRYIKYILFKKGIWYNDISLTSYQKQTADKMMGHIYDPKTGKKIINRSKLRNIYKVFAIDMVIKGEIGWESINFTRGNNEKKN